MHPTEPLRPEGLQSQIKDTTSLNKKIALYWKGNGKINVQKKGIKTEEILSYKVCDSTTQKSLILFHSHFRHLFYLKVVIVGHF